MHAECQVLHTAGIGVLLQVRPSRLGQWYHCSRGYNVMVIALQPWLLPVKVHSGTTRQILCKEGIKHFGSCRFLAVVCPALLLFV
jgi:hypothetical protein